MRDVPGAGLTAPNGHLCDGRAGAHLFPRPKGARVWRDAPAHTPARSAPRAATRPRVRLGSAEKRGLPVKLVHAADLHVDSP
ncbi:MAG TPA: hypothetical protein PK141_24595, partial [Polyangiaceae bacterium]|nr:hypothetical protein [Polyangiaceae bacterium]